LADAEILLSEQFTAGTAVSFRMPKTLAIIAGFLFLASAMAAVVGEVRRDAEQPLDDHQLAAVMHFVLLGRGEHFELGFHARLHAYHGSDVQYLFNRMGVAAPFTQDQQRLSQAMVSYWTQFATTGDPNSAGRPVWLRYDASTDLRQSFVPPVPGVTLGFAADHSCAFWDSF
jgi:hypothetical protein